MVIVAAAADGSDRRSPPQPKATQLQIGLGCKPQNGVKTGRSYQQATRLQLKALAGANKVPLLSQLCRSCCLTLEPIPREEGGWAHPGQRMMQVVSGSLQMAGHACWILVWGWDCRLRSVLCVVQRFYWHSYAVGWLGSDVFYQHSHANESPSVDGYNSITV